MSLSYRALPAWNAAMAFAESVYRLSARLSHDDLIGLGAQLRRASLALPAAIAEAWERRDHDDYARLLGVAAGSLAALETRLELGLRLGQIERVAMADVTHLAERVAELIETLRRDSDDRAHRGGGIAEARAWDRGRDED